VWSADGFHNTQHKDSVKHFSHPCYVHNAVKCLYAETEVHYIVGRHKTTFSLAHRSTTLYSLI